MVSGDCLYVDKPWESLVPRAVVEFMIEHRLSQRLKEVCGEGRGPWRSDVR